MVCTQVLLTIMLLCWIDVEVEAIAPSSNPPWLGPTPDDLNFMYLIETCIPISARSKTAVNVGARGGREQDPLQNVFGILQFGGLQIEGDKSILPELYKNSAGMNDSKLLYVVPEFTSSHNILASLRRHNIPKQFDALKIDIDSIDFVILKTVLGAKYLPKIVMMEFNPDIPPPLQWYVEEAGFTFQYHRILNGGYYGVSADAIFEIMTTHGYRLLDFELLDPSSPIECLRCEHNMWFIQEEFALSSWGPKPSRGDMVRRFWDHQALVGDSCLHIDNAGQFCPLAHPRRHELAYPENVGEAYHLLTAVVKQMNTLCPECQVHASVTERWCCNASTMSLTTDTAYAPYAKTTLTDILSSGMLFVCVVLLLLIGVRYFKRRSSRF